LKKYGKILLYSDSEQSKMHLRSKVESAKLPVDADAIYRYNRRRQTWAKDKTKREKTKYTWGL